MSKNNERFDVNTKDVGWFQSSYAANIRDNKTGKEYKGYGSTPEKARDAAWRKTPKNR